MDVCALATVAPASDPLRFLRSFHISTMSLIYLTVKSSVR
jgi:hypothetical protein